VGALTSFDAIIGHETQIEVLRRTLRTGRVAGAYLFAGPDGVGKRTLARTFAAALNCVQSSDDACGVCVSCRKIADENHPDVRAVAPDGATFKVEQVRDIQRQISWKPIEGRYKVFVLLDVDRMRAEGANALLKTLEEPPGAGVVILVTSNANALLPTIRSRCQLLKFCAVPVETLASGLTSRAVAPDRAREMALLSQGRVADALTWAASETSVTGGVVPEVLTHLSLLAAFRLAEQWQSRPDLLDTLLTWYRDLIWVSIGGDTSALTHPQQRSTLELLARQTRPSILRDHMKAIMEAQARLRRNINATLTMESLALRLLQSVSDASSSGTAFG
jgi:DNA polymerase-3 subunit delta'